MRGVKKDTKVRIIPPTTFGCVMYMHKPRQLHWYQSDCCSITKLPKGNGSWIVAYCWFARPIQLVWEIDSSIGGYTNKRCTNWWVLLYGEYQLYEAWYTIKKDLPKVSYLLPKEEKKLTSITPMPKSTPIGECDKLIGEIDSIVEELKTPISKCVLSH